MRPDKREEEKHVEHAKPIVPRDDVGVEKVSPLRDTLQDFSALKLVLSLLRRVSATRTAHADPMHAACPNETREGEHADVEEHHGASEADERGFVLVTRPRFILRGAVQKLQGNLAADGIRGDAKDGQSVQDAQVERLLAFGIESHTHPHPPRLFLQQRVEHAAM